MQDIGKRHTLKPVAYNRQSVRPVESRQRLGRAFRPVEVDSYYNVVRRLVVFVILVAIVAGGGSVAFLGYKAFKAGSAIFVGNQNSGALPLVGAISGGGDRDDLPILNWEEKRARINVLVLGLDRRPQEDPGYTRTDTMIVVSINPADMSAAMISVPRDLEVPYKHDGYTQRIRVNAVHVYGHEKDVKGSGPAAAKKVVSEVLGLPIHYFVRIDFQGFRRLIDEVGGITMEVANRLYDYEYPNDNYGYTKVEIDPGVQVMDGDTALKYARSRHSIDASQAGDLNRAKRQQQVSVALKDKLIATRWGLISDPIKLAALLDTLEDNVLLDITLSELVKLADLGRQIDTSNPRKISTMVLGEPLIHYEDRPGNGFRFYPTNPSYEGIRDAVAAFLDDPFVKSDIQSEGAIVRFENGTPQVGVASQLGFELRQNYGIETESPVNADRTDYQKTLIYDLSSDSKPRTLEFIEKILQATATVPTELFPGETADIVVIIGQDYLDRQGPKIEAP